VYKERNIILRRCATTCAPTSAKCCFDSAAAYEEARVHLEHSMPQSLPSSKLYQTRPLFSRSRSSRRSMSAHDRKVSLPSGGAIVIDHTEALTTIDVNSARSTGGGARSRTRRRRPTSKRGRVARQLRLRDPAGWLVIDFIDMESPKNQRQVEDQLHRACYIDRARIQFGRISRFGLLEMSRQRMQPSLGEHTQIPCHAARRGQIRSVRVASRCRSCASSRKRADEGEHRARDRAAPRRRRHVPAQREAHRDGPPSRRATTST